MGSSSVPLGAAGHRPRVTLRNACLEATLKRCSLTLTVLMAMVAALAAPNDARAEETDASDPASTEAPKPVPSLDMESHSLRFADREQVLFRVGFGGVYQDGFLGNPKAQASYGLTLRWERPVHEYVTTGLALSFYGVKPQFIARQPAFEFALHLKGRFPFEMGRKERKFESEVYLLAEGGLLIWVDTNALDLNLVGPGWVIGLAPGFLFFINKRIGLLAELGWVHTEAFFSRGRLSVLLHQGVARVGMVFPF